MSTQRLPPTCYPNMLRFKRGLWIGESSFFSRFRGIIVGIAGMSIVVLFCVLNDRKNNKSTAPNALEWPITKIGREREREGEEGAF